MNIVPYDGGVKIIYGNPKTPKTPNTLKPPKIPKIPKTPGASNLVRRSRCTHSDKFKFYPNYTKYPVKYTNYQDDDNKKDNKVDDVVFVYHV